MSLPFGPETLGRSLRRLPRVRRYSVAYSGGADSQALLHALVALRASFPDVSVDAVHVHHGWSKHADGWARGCRAAAESLGVSCEVVHVDTRARRGMGPEAAAREARYAALACRVNEGEAVLTAHHQDDQAETVLLQLLRGSGVRGLAAMPAVSPLGAGRLLRPLLQCSRLELVDYLQRSGQSWIDDDSNRDLTLARNYLRLELFPLFENRWPAVSRRLARAAGHFAEAQSLLDELASDDLAQVRDSCWGLQLVVLRTLSVARQRNALRTWLRDAGLPLPSSAVLERVLVDLMPARADSVPLVRWAGAEVRRYRDVLYAGPPLPGVPDAPVPWDGCSCLQLPPGLGWLRVSEGLGVGLDRQCMDTGRVEVDFRRGGERCRPSGTGGTRSLKKILQDLNVPPWLRPYIPLLRIDGKLAAVGDFLVCEPFQAAPGMTGRELRWERGGQLYPPPSEATDE